MTIIDLSLDDLCRLGFDVPMQNGRSEPADAIVRNTCRGQVECHAHGLYRLTCLRTLKAGKVRPEAVQSDSYPTEAIIRVDAEGGLGTFAKR